MRVRSNVSFKFLSNIYRKFKAAKLKSFEMNIHKLSQQIELEKKQYAENLEFLKSLQQNNNVVKEKYAELFTLFKIENKTITIKNNNYNIKQWDNLLIEKRAKNYIIQTKRNEDIYIFEESMNVFFEFFLTLQYSIIVLSVDKARITLQFRLKD